MKKLLMIILSFVLFTVFSCSKKEVESKSMEQIYSDEGVPVTIEKIKTQDFVKSLNYSGVLTGIEQSSAYASLGDKIEKVLVKVGDKVKKDQILVTFPTDAPSAKYNQAREAFHNIEKTYNRYKLLLKSGAISQQDFDNISTQYKVKKSDWDAVRTMVKVKSPISGFVTKVSVNETDNVQAEAELVTISNTTKLKSRIYVSENDYIKLHIGQKVTAQWNNFDISGNIRQIDMAKDFNRQGFGVMVEFDNPNNKVPAGVTVELKMIIKSKTNILVLEKKYINNIETTPFVVIESNGKALVRNVKIGERSELQYEILDGLKPGDNLITKGYKIVKEGQKVKVLNKG